MYPWKPLVKCFKTAITVTKCTEAHYRGPFKIFNQSLSCFYKPNQMKLKVYKRTVQGQIYFSMATDRGHFWTTNINTVHCLRGEGNTTAPFARSWCNKPWRAQSASHAAWNLGCSSPSHLSADLLSSCQIPSSRFSSYLSSWMSHCVTHLIVLIKCLLQRLFF